LIIFALLAFNLWHGCHRIYHATHDFKFHPPLWVKFAIYGVAALGTLIILLLLF
ncbi:MAG: fumarate reductase subunit D, partial [Flavobacteriales bacterium]